MWEKEGGNVISKGPVEKHIWFDKKHNVVKLILKCNSGQNYLSRGPMTKMSIQTRPKVQKSSSIES